jgi:hypothetical protein
MLLRRSMSAEIESAVIDRRYSARLNIFED